MVTVCTGCEECNIAKHVESGDYGQSTKTVIPDAFDGILQDVIVCPSHHSHVAYLDFIDNIECIFKASVREYDPVKGIGHTPGGDVSFEQIVEVCIRLLDSRMTAKNNETENGDEHQSQHLENPDHVGNSV